MAFNFEFFIRNTFVKRNKSITSNEHGKRLYLAVVKHYLKHISKVSIVALSSDAFIVKKLQKHQSERLKSLAGEMRRVLCE